VVIALSAFGGYQRAGCLTRRLTLRHKIAAQTIPWQPLSEEAIQQALAQGNGCLWISRRTGATCKVNEHRVLNQPDVIAALRQPDVVALRGDWSQPSAFIADFLAKRNRYAIPFNAVYAACLMAKSSRRCWTSTLVTTLNNAKG
jgi:suppressor for copper-sensitivity B